MVKNIKLLLMALMVLSVSCVKQDRENTIISQEESIDSYIASLSDVEIVRNNGANRVIFESDGEAQEVAQIGDSLYIRYAGYIFSGGPRTLFITNDTSMVSDKNFYQMEKPYKIKLGSTPLVEGLNRGLEGVTEGEHCYIIFSAKYGFYNSEVSTVPKLSPLLYEIWVDKLIKESK